MPNHRVTVHLRVRYAWWLWSYLSILATVAKLLDRDPEMDKVERMVARGTRVEAVPIGDTK
jgi:hypothetical protein